MHCNHCSLLYWLGRWSYAYNEATGCHIAAHIIFTIKHRDSLPIVHAFLCIPCVFTLCSFGSIFVHGVVRLSRGGFTNLVNTNKLADHLSTQNTIDQWADRKITHCIGSRVARWFLVVVVYLAIEVRVVLKESRNTGRLLDRSKNDCHFLSMRMSDDFENSISDSISRYLCL